MARPVGAPAGWLLACGIDVEMDTKPRTSLQKRLGYFSLMLMGVGSMLLAITVGTNSDRITTFAGLGFVLSARQSGKHRNAESESPKAVG